MTPLAPLLQAFFADRLIAQRRVTPHTIAAYRDSFRLLLEFASQKLKKAPSNLQLDEMDASLVGEFLNHLEHSRKNSIRTRNARLAALRSFYCYLAIREPANLALIQRVLAIPQKKFERNIVRFLEPSEIEAILAVPDQKTWLGRRDHALLLMTVQTGLRVSEVTGLKLEDLQFGPSPHVRCRGKGRKERCTPLTQQTVAALRAWLRERKGAPSDPLFPSARGTPLSRDAVEWLTKKYALIASQKQPSLKTKTISPHVFRHTAAVRLLQAGVDRSVIALWLGHEQVETTQIYLHADLSIKERAIARTAPLTAQSPTRYRPNDQLLAFLQEL
ncbi:MAG: site-specific integrase [Verrucomicrobiota bacterium]